MASSLFPSNRSNQHSNPSDANNGLLQRFQDFAKGITPQEAERRINDLLSSGQMSRSQFNALANQAKQFMKFIGLK